MRRKIMKFHNLEEEDAKYLLALYAGNALSALLPIYDGLLNPTELSVRCTNYAQALLVELDRRLSNGHSSELS